MVRDSQVAAAGTHASGHGSSDIWRRASTRPLLLTVGRSALILAAQATASLVFILQGDRAPWMSASHWWTVYGTLADVGCLALLWRFTRAEGTTLRGLIGPVHWRRGRDLWIGLGLFLLIFPLMVLGGMLSNSIVYGTMTADPNPTGAVHPGIPLWGVVYSRSAWWIIWSATEELTYQGYALARLRALFRPWIALVVVGFWWALQHSFLPFIPDWRYVLWRFVMVVPGIVVMMLAYLRVGRLTPLIVAHWPMDVIVAWMATRS